MIDPNDFDNYADDYRSIHTNNVQKLTGKDSDYFSEYKIKEIYGTFKDKKKMRILDVGCGDGNSAAFFRKYFPDCDYYGIDISEKSIDVATKKYSDMERMSFSVYDGSHIPFEDDSFDLIFIACVMHHIDKRQHKAIMKECMRVLSPSGNLIIFEHNPYNPLTMRSVNTCPFDEDAVLMNSKYLRKLLAFIGYKNIEVRYTIFVPRFGPLEKLTFIEKYLYKLPIGGQYYINAKKR